MRQVFKFKNITKWIIIWCSLGVEYTKYREIRFHQQHIESLWNTALTPTHVTCRPQFIIDFSQYSLNENEEETNVWKNEENFIRLNKLGERL